MDTEHILVFFRYEQGKWTPVERENIPDWLRDQDVVEKLIAGEKAINTADKDPMYWCAIQVERPRPIGYRDQMRRAKAGADGKTAGGIQLLQ